MLRNRNAESKKKKERISSEPIVVVLGIPMRTIIAETPISEVQTTITKDMSLWETPVLGGAGRSFPGPGRTVTVGHTTCMSLRFCHGSLSEHVVGITIRIFVSFSLLSESMSSNAVELIAIEALSSSTSWV
jgi:hypothetical protein